MEIQSTSSAWEADDWVACMPGMVSGRGTATRRRCNWRRPASIGGLRCRSPAKSNRERSPGKRVVDIGQPEAPDIVAALLDETLPAEVTAVRRSR